MNRATVLDKLSDYKDLHREEYFLEEIGIFGSMAQDSASNESDIDIVVKLGKPDMFILGNIKTDLEEEFGRKIDIVRLRKSMNPFSLKKIEKEAIFV